MPIQGRHWLATSMLIAGCSMTAVSAHVTPPRVLMTEREALQRLFPGTGEAQPQQLRLDVELRQQILKQFGWKADSKYRVFPVGPSGGSGALFVVVDYTLHGPVRSAVAIDGQGRVKGSQVLELQEEAYLWVKPIIDSDFAKPYVGSDCGGEAKPPSPADGSGDNMVKFYRSIVVNQLCHAAILHRMALKK